MLISADSPTGNAIMFTSAAYSCAPTYDAFGNVTTCTTMSGTHVIVQASRYDSRGS